MIRKASLVRTVRCAIYTRKSTEEGLEQEFNSLDAQREAGEAYIASQRSEGWACLPDRYDDGGYTGGNMDRPALKRLMEDVAFGRIDCIVVYKVDRLSRSLMDFARIMEIFDKHNVSFVSVTQQFNTTSSMGRLTLNILLSFAQFEREIISERTRDKIAAARRKGKWSGGVPVLGYDVVPEGGRIVVNEEEAVQVKAIFKLYIEHQALIPVVKELNRRQWTTKRWTNRDGIERGGRQWAKTAVYSLLRNVLYTGKISLGPEAFDGEHQAIVTESIFHRVQDIMQRNRVAGGRAVRNKHGALLRGLLYCRPCNCAMVHSYSSKGARRYRYYLCQTVQKRGWDACSTKSVPAVEIEKFIVNQVRNIAKNEALLAEALRQVKDEAQSATRGLEAEQASLAREMHSLNRELKAATGKAPGRLADIQAQLHRTDCRLTEIADELARLERRMPDDREFESALKLFDPVWQTLSPLEQARVVELLVKRVDYDGQKGKVAVTFHDSGLAKLAESLAG